MNTPISHTAEKEVIEEHLEQQHFERDTEVFESILKRQIPLDDAALSSTKRHPLKRLFDVFAAVTALVVAGPPMLLTAVLIKLTSPGPILFKQQRVGFMGKIFTMYKFRTMEVEADSGMHRDYVTDLVNNGRPMAKIDGQHRLIPFGKIIRRLFIDELPQLFNVIRGEMSLVGPRPAIPYEVQAYHDWHMKRLLAIPGMTGLWQVSGKNRLTFDEMVQLDIHYAHNCSFVMDMKILCMTPVAIVSEVRNKQNH
ncbi:MAG: sugar transferase [Planctomycetota bacterium]|jgi:lipopolysaccharide/colanic/teichoic acid biosynthesis glycosyltransferase